MIEIFLHKVQLVFSFLMKEWTLGSKFQNLRLIYNFCLFNLQIFSFKKVISDFLMNCIYTFCGNDFLMKIVASTSLA